MFRTTALLVALGLGLSLAPAPAGAELAYRGGPGDAARLSALTLIVPATVDAGSPFQISYTSRGFRGVQLQRRVGTKHLWRKVVDLPPGAHIATAPGVPMGEQALRLVGIENRRVVGLSRVSHVESFGIVPLKVLANGQGGSVVIGSNTFNYVKAPNFDSIFYTNSGTEYLKQTTSTCRHLHFDIAVDSRSSSAGNAVDTFTLYQAAADPTARTIQPNTIGAIDADVEFSNSWSLTISGGYYAYLNGWGSCVSATPF